MDFIAVSELEVIDYCSLTPGYSQARNLSLDTGLFSHIDIKVDALESYQSLTCQ